MKCGSELLGLRIRSVRFHAVIEAERVISVRDLSVASSLPSDVCSQADNLRVITSDFFSWADQITFVPPMHELREPGTIIPLTISV